MKRSPTYISLLAPALLLSIGSLHPGNWATCIEGGSRFGYELVWVVFLANSIALLLHTLALHLGLVSGKHLAQACHDEYPIAVCLLLWFLTETSLVVLDCAMVLSSAVGLNLLLGLPLLVGVLVAAVDVPFLMSLLPSLGPLKAELVVGVIAVSAVFVSVLNALLGRPSIVPILGGLWPRLKSDSLYAIVALFGANVMPHNLYLNSAIVQHKSNNQARLIFIWAIPLAINLSIMVASATTFHNAGFAALTLQDGYAIMEQGLNRSLAPLAFGLALLCAGVLSTLTGTMVCQIASEGLLGKRIDAWLHRLLMRVAAVIIAYICAWSCGSEGAYQMLLLSQVVLAFQLPFLSIPLIRLTSSTAYLGKSRISPPVELLAWLGLIFVLLLNICLLFSAFFGHSEDWGGPTSWEFHDSNIFLVVLVVSILVALLLWLSFTPIRSDGVQVTSALPETLVPTAEPPVSTPVLEEGLDTRACRSDEKQGKCRAEDRENDRITVVDHAEPYETGEISSPLSSAAAQLTPTEAAQAEDATEPQATEEEEDEEEFEEEESRKPVGVEESWEEVADFDRFLSATGAGVSSGESVISRTESNEVGTLGSEGGGSFSRLSGLGRAARRQFAAILDEFWGRLFDFHGQPVGQDSASSPMKTNACRNSWDARRNSLSGDAFGTTHSASTSQSWLRDFAGRDHRYSSLRHFSYHEDLNFQPATIHGYNLASYNRPSPVESVRARPERIPSTYHFRTNVDDTSQQEVGSVFSKQAGDRYDQTATMPGEYEWSSFSTKTVDKWNPLVYRATGELEKSLQGDSAPLSFDDISPSQSHRDGFSIQAASQTESLWSRQPFEQLFGTNCSKKRALVSLSHGVEFGWEVFEHLQLCVRKLLQLEGSDWLFRTDNGCDEDLVAGIAATAREKSALESAVGWHGRGSGLVAPCSDSCVWGSSLLVVSFGVWCIHRLLELALMESRPELWGKYTYVLNRLQGIIEPAFSNATRIVMQPCSCCTTRKKVNSADAPCPWSWGRNTSNPNGKPASGSRYLEMIKEVEMAVGSRKGRTGTAAGDVAFPKGKENLASVLKRYKRRLGGSKSGRRLAQATKQGNHLQHPNW